MRNTLVGAALAVVLVAALFAAAHYGRRPAETPAAALSPEQMAASIKSDFIGEQRIGDWKLVCGPGRVLPKPPPGQHLSGNSEGLPPREAPPPPGWKIPRCRVAMALRSAHNPQDEVRLTFRQVGFKRVLALFLRMPPDEVSNGDAVTVRWDQAEWQIPVMSCAAQFCLAIHSIKFVDRPIVENAKQLQISFRPTTGDRQVAIKVPVNGLAPALGAMRRIDK